MTNFSGQPLFGKDSSPQRTSKIIASIITCICWIIFLICMAFIKPVEKAPKYKDVQIVLESAPVIKEEIKNHPKEIESQASSANDIQQENKIEKKVADKTVKRPASVSNTVKKSVQKTESYDEWDDFDYALDPMEAFAQQTAKTPKKEADWDEMFGEEQTAVSSGGKSGRVVGKSSFEGTAGVVSKDKNQGVKSSQVQDDIGNWQASESTSGMLGEISNTKFVSSAVNGVSSETKIASSKSGEGKVYIKMSNGRTRALIRPESPAITLSKEAAASIDVSKTVTIKFLVMKNGTVPSTRIEIKPVALLPGIVQQEIKEQISQWLFESDNYDAFAEFEYKIVKK